MNFQYVNQPPKSLAFVYDLLSASVETNSSKVYTKEIQRRMSLYARIVDYGYFVDLFPRGIRIRLNLWRSKRLCTLFYIVMINSNKH